MWIRPTASSCSWPVKPREASLAMAPAGSGEPSGWRRLPQAFPGLRFADPRTGYAEPLDHPAGLVGDDGGGAEVVGVEIAVAAPHDARTEGQFAGFIVRLSAPVVRCGGTSGSEVAMADREEKAILADVEKDGDVLRLLDGRRLRVSPDDVAVASVWFPSARLTLREGRAQGRRAPFSLTVTNEDSGDTIAAEAGR
jgi:hypothetical protein